jgi:hypothetical protein
MRNCTEARDDSPKHLFKDVSDDILIRASGSSFGPRILTVGIHTVAVAMLGVRRHHIIVGSIGRNCTGTGTSLGRSPEYMGSLARQESRNQHIGRPEGHNSVALANRKPFC